MLSTVNTVELLSPLWHPYVAITQRPPLPSLPCYYGRVCAILGASVVTKASSKVDDQVSSKMLKLGGRIFFCQVFVRKQNFKSPLF